MEHDSAAADHDNAQGALGLQANANRASAVVDQTAIMAELERLNEGAETVAAALVLAKVSTRRFFVTVVLALVTIVAIGLAVLAVQHGQVDRDSRSADQRARIIDLQQQIVSCTTPQGACYKRGQAQTAKAVGTLSQQSAAASAAAAACAQTLSGYVAIRGCVDRAIAPPP